MDRILEYTQNKYQIGSCLYSLSMAKVVQESQMGLNILNSDD